MSARFIDPAVSRQLRNNSISAMHDDHIVFRITLVVRRHSVTDRNQRTRTALHCNCARRLMLIGRWHVVARWNRPLSTTYRTVLGAFSIFSIVVRASEFHRLPRYKASPHYTDAVRSPSACTRSIGVTYQRVGDGEARIMRKLSPQLLKHVLAVFSCARELADDQTRLQM